MPEENMAVLIEKYLDGVATPEEIKLVDEWYHSFDVKSPLYAEDSLTAGELTDERFASLCIQLGIEPVTVLSGKNKHG